MITIRVDKATRDLTKGVSGLSKQQIATATAQAINKTLLKGRTVARTAVKKVYNIPQKNLSGIDIKKAYSSHLTGYIYASSKPIPMDAFNPRFQLLTGGKVSGIQSITRRGLVKVTQVKRAKAQGGVTIEVKKGDKQIVPYAFLLPNSKPRVFARGEYKAGDGSYGFIQRHTRLENDSGNDSVKPLVSVTVFGAVINPAVMGNIATVIRSDYERNMIAAIKFALSRNG